MSAGPITYCGIKNDKIKIDNLCLGMKDWQNRVNIRRTENKFTQKERHICP